MTLRISIQSLNLREAIRIGEDERTIAAWLTWRKEVLPGYRAFLNSIRASLEKLRKEAGTRQIGVVNVDASKDAKYNDVLVNINEVELANEIEHLELVVGTLDGQLSLKNATTFIEV